MKRASNPKGRTSQGMRLAVCSRAGLLGIWGLQSVYLPTPVGCYTTHHPHPPPPPAGDRLNREGLEYFAMKFSAVSYKKVVGQCSRVILACH